MRRGYVPEEPHLYPFLSGGTICSWWDGARAAGGGDGSEDRRAAAPVRSIGCRGAGDGVALERHEAEGAVIAAPLHDRDALFLDSGTGRGDWRLVRSGGLRDGIPFSLSAACYPERVNAGGSSCHKWPHPRHRQYAPPRSVLRVTVTSLFLQRGHWTHTVADMGAEGSSMRANFLSLLHALSCCGPVRRSMNLCRGMERITMGGAKPLQSGGVGPERPERQVGVAARASATSPGPPKSRGCDTNRSRAERQRKSLSRYNGALGASR